MINCRNKHTFRTRQPPFLYLMFWENLLSHFYLLPKFQDFFFKFSDQKHDSKSHYKVFQCKIDNNDQLLYENIPILFFLSTSLNVLIFTVNFNIYIVDYFSLNLSLPVTIESWYSNFFSLLSKLPLISIIFYWNILKICCSKIFFFFSPNKCQYYPNKWKKNYEFHYSN